MLEQGHRFVIFTIIKRLTMLQERRKRKSRFANSDSESDEDDGDLKAVDEEKKKLTDTSPGTAARAPAQSAVPPGPPPGLPPGLPPGK